ncbi:class I SAM-dependent methyltransferase [Sporolactobacillus pectinivorans]|uniref:class I SAM-dependent methyltransferase n=1 Tax=Sporolactobacillus pectinivorans TaxID=1591408 RepID=UPI000C267A58|nr:class I SAM-dependent methyltransferase [Sporolactobacillus pectinivorans]
MFPEHPFTIWGTHCGNCGNVCSILQNAHHPWNCTPFTVKLKCSTCGHDVTIDQKAAEAFYNHKILTRFEGLFGYVVDLGCGGGFLSRFLLQNKNIKRIDGLDRDPDCLKATEDLAASDQRFNFTRTELRRLNALYDKNSTDFIVSRDVFMFIDDTEQYFDDVSSIATRGVRQMGWYMTDNHRMKNGLQPQKIAEAYQKRGWQVSLEYLDWYKSGYFIKTWH